MLLHAEWPRIEVESARGERNIDLPSWKILGHTLAGVVCANLDEEDGVRGIIGTVMAHLREKCSGDDEEYREEEIPKREGWQSWIIVETNDSSHVEGNVSDRGVVVVQGGGRVVPGGSTPRFDLLLSDFH